MWQVRATRGRENCSLYGTIIHQMHCNVIIVCFCPLHVDFHAPFTTLIHLPWCSVIVQCHQSVPKADGAKWPATGWPWRWPQSGSWPSARARQRPPCCARSAARPAGPCCPRALLLCTGTGAPEQGRHLGHTYTCEGAGWVGLGLLRSPLGFPSRLLDNNRREYTSREGIASGQISDSTAYRTG